MTAIQHQVYRWSCARPAWQRDLLRRVAAGSLSDVDRLEVRAILLGGNDAPPPVPVEIDDLPADAGELGDVSLTRVGNLEGINALAAGQNLEFGPGLNVVFGENGAGKSGYGRLLRRVCRAATQGEVLRDVFDPGASSRPQTARIHVTVGEQAPTEHVVTLGERPPRILSAVGMFDARCAEFVVDQESTIDWLPGSLRLLRSLANAQDDLARELRDESREARVTAPVLPSVTLGTPAAEAITDLDADTDLAPIERLAQLSDEEQDELERLERTAAVSDAGRAELEHAARARAAAVAEVIADLRTAAGRVSDRRISGLNAALERRDVAIAAERELAATALAGTPVVGIGDDHWRRLWESARALMAAHEHRFPPEEGETCPLCQQSIDEETDSRMAQFEGFVLGEQRGAAAAAQREIDTWILDLPAPEPLRERVAARLALVPEGDAVATAREALGSTLERLDAVRARISGEPAQIPSFRGELGALEAFGVGAGKEADRLSALADAGERRRVEDRRRQLFARRQLGEGIAAVRAHLAALRRADTLDSAARKLSTAQVTQLIGRLSQEVITERLRAALSEELAGLDPVAGRIRLLPRPAKGEISVRLEFEGSRVSVGAVLSEGEQRGLALAFFLAEASVRGDGSALVLDDPVSSLDHGRRRWVAQRLAREAERRQVIIFTHDLAFLHFLDEAVREQGSGLSGLQLTRNRGKVGIVLEGLPIDGAAPARRRGLLRERLKQLVVLHGDDDPSYRDEVERWLLDLRRGYEGIIEDYLLRGVVRRMSMKIQQSHLPKVLARSTSREAGPSRDTSELGRSAPQAARAPSAAVLADRAAAAARRVQRPVSRNQSASQPRRRPAARRAAGRRSSVSRGRSGRPDGAPTDHAQIDDQQRATDLVALP